VEDKLIYEPRAFWSVARATPTAVDVPVQVALNREHFRNGGRHPIVLEKFLIAPVGSTLIEYNGKNTPPTINADRDDCAAAIQKIRLFITAPGRQHFSFEPLLTNAWSPEATADPSFFSGLFNVVRWDFTKTLFQPRGYGIEFKLGGFLIQPSGIAIPGPDANRPKARIAFYERGGMLTGNARVFQPSVGIDRNGNAGNNFPFPPDGLGSSAGQGGNQNVFTVNGNEFRKKQQSQAGSEQLTGFAVQTDVIGYEDAVVAQAPVEIATQTLASVALRMPVTCRTVGGVVDRYWWRENAPLALVCPTITPAQVYSLRRPIVLHPGDVLDLQAEVPGGFASSAPATILPTYQFGVSFTGYAIVEG
jgi:hypothetical protein